jgi:hypothetical protein
VKKTLWQSTERLVGMIHVLATLHKERSLIVIHKRQSSGGGDYRPDVVELFRGGSLKQLFRTVDFPSFDKVLWTVPSFDGSC